MTKISPHLWYTDKADDTNLRDEYARAQRIDRISVAVCRSQACLELREIAKELFHFERAAWGAFAFEVAVPYEILSDIYAEV